MNRNVEKKQIWKKAKALASYYEPASSMAEQFLMVQESVEQLAKNASSYTTLLSSPHAGQGTTVSAANLAIVMAQSGKKVLIVDANLRTPALQTYFGTGNTSGLIGLLQGKGKLQTATVPTAVKGLTLLPAGNGESYSSRLLYSAPLESIFQEFKAHYDRVVIDSPPVLDYADTTAIAQYCDSALLVLKYGRTQNEAALQAKHKLQTTEIRLLGAILNQKPVSRAKHA